MQQPHLHFWKDRGNIWLLAPALILGLALGIFISGYWLIDLLPADSKQLILFTILVSLFSAAGYWLLLGWIKTRIPALSVWVRFGLGALSVVVGTFLLLAGTSQWQSNARYVPFLLPSHTLEIKVIPNAASSDITLLWFDTSLGDVSFDKINFQGWKRQGDQLVLENPSSNSFRWSGKTGGRAQLVFKGFESNENVFLSWDGREEALKPSAGKLTNLQEFDVPWYASTGMVLALGMISLTILSFALILLIWEKRAALRAAFRDSLQRASRPLDRMDTTLLLGCVILALLLRIPNLDNLFPAVDEYYQLIAARQIVEGASLASVYPRSLWLVTVPVSIAFRIFGYKLWAARAVGAIFNILAVIPLYLLTRKINRPIATLSAALYATSPWIITFARITREYAYYPFYFYWIIYGMILFVEAIPAGFVFFRDWRILLKPRIILLGLALIIPLLFVLRVDALSTSRAVLIVYPVLGIFALQRFSLKNKLNLPILALLGIGVVAAAYALYAWQSVKLFSVPTLNLFPSQYFFPNPQQQWYFNRVVMIVALGVLGAVLFALLTLRVNFVPLFLLTLFGSFLAVFMFFSKTFFHTRHLSTTQLWYIVVTAMGLYVVWQVIRVIWPVRGAPARILLAAGLGLCIFNVNQTLLPVISNNPDMPISEDYYHNMSLVNAYMLNHVTEHEVLISTVYGLYASWNGQPKFDAQYRVFTQTPREDISAIVNQWPSGWIVLDQIRLGLSPISPKDFLADRRIKYVGLFGDEYIWHWEHASAPSGALEVLGKGK